MADAEPREATKYDYVKLRGILWPPMVTEESLEAIRTLPVRHDDILIATFPKAGTNWLLEMCHLILANGASEQINQSQLGWPLEFGKYWGVQTKASPDRRPLYQRVGEWQSPRVLATHAPVQHLPQEVLTHGKGRVITSLRNPKDSAVSEFHFLNKIRQEAPVTFAKSLEENFFTDAGPYGSWFGHVLGYWGRRHEKNHLVLKYENMKMDTRGAIIQIADFLGKPLSEAVVDKIASLVTVDSMRARYYTPGEKPVEKKIGPLHLIRKGVVGDWKTQFTVAQNEAFDTLCRENLAGSGLQFDFE